MHGEKIHVVHVYPSVMALDFWPAIFAFSVNFIPAVTISFFTKPRPEKELAGLVYSLTPKPVGHHMAWCSRSSVTAIGLLLAGLSPIFL